MAEREDPQSIEPAPAAIRPPRSRRRVRVGPDVRERRRRILRDVLLAGAAILIVNAVVGENGYLATLRARQEQERVRAEVTRLRQDNQQLRELARRLKVDPIAQEEAARRQFGLIRPGETLVILRDAKPASQ
jgi:cell division protein FtsB